MKRQIYKQNNIFSLVNVENTAAEFSNFAKLNVQASLTSKLIQIYKHVLCKKNLLDIQKTNFPSELFFEELHATDAQ